MKRLCYILVSVFMIVGLFSSITYAKSDTEKTPLWGFIDSVWFEYEISEDFFLPDQMRGEHALNRVNRYGIGAESRSLLIPSEKWAILCSLQYSAHKANEQPDYGQDTGFKEWGILFGIKRYLWERAYVGLHAGLSYVDEFPNFENRDWPDRSLESNVGRSHTLGSWGASVGYNWRIPKIQNWSVMTEARITHTSDPWSTDMGKNLAGLGLKLVYNFGPH